MKKVEKFLKHIARLEPGSAPSAGYFEEIILEAREAKAEFETWRKTEMHNFNNPNKNNNETKTKLRSRQMLQNPGREGNKDNRV